jgi:hypothetical protein
METHKTEQQLRSEGYRPVPQGETVKSGDYVAPFARDSDRWELATGWISKEVGSRVYGHLLIRAMRKYTAPWFSYSDLEPEETDADLKGQVLYLFKDGSVGLYRWDHKFTNSTPTHFMSIVDPNGQPIVKSEPPITITSDGMKHMVVFNQNGDVQVGCTTVESSVFDAIVQRRQKTQKA